MSSDRAGIPLLLNCHTGALSKSVAFSVPQWSKSTVHQYISVQAAYRDSGREQWNLKMSDSNRNLFSLNIILIESVFQFLFVS